MKLKIILVFAALQQFQQLVQGNSHMVGVYELAENYTSDPNLVAYYATMKYPDIRRDTYIVVIKEKKANKTYEMLYAVQDAMIFVSLKFGKPSSQMHPNGQNGTLLVTNPEENKIVEEWQFKKFNATITSTFTEESMKSTLTVKNVTANVVLDRLVYGKRKPKAP